jgi:WhiB family redox-sensing transcriptional regulator
VSKPWQNRAACLGEDATPTFDKPLGAKSKEFVRKFCGGCEVKAECLAFAMETEKTSVRYGVFGGLTAAERAGLALYGMRVCPDCQAVFIPTQGKHRRCPECRRGLTTVPPVAREVEGHGTRAGYERHQRRREEPCWSCLEAKRKHSRWRRVLERLRGAA